MVKVLLGFGLEVGQWIRGGLPGSSYSKLKEAYSYNGQSRHVDLFWNLNQSEITFGDFSTFHKYLQIYYKKYMQLLKSNYNT